MTSGNAIRNRLRWLSLAADIALALVCFQIAFAVFFWFHHYGLRLTGERLDWGIPLALLAICGTFLSLGLYKLEAYVSRPLHLLTLFKGTLVALVITAFFAFVFKAPVVNDSRLTVFTAFAAFFALDSLVRIGLLERLYRHDVRERPGGSLVIGVAADTSVLAGRCRELRGFAPVHTAEPLQLGRNGLDVESALLEAIAAAEPAPRQVFLDGPSLGFKTTFDLIAAARARGADVYVTGRLVSPLDTTRLLLRLFELPLMRVRQDPAAGDGVSASKRAFDVAAAATALVLFSPLIVVIALAVRGSSPGPVFFRQNRIGLRGRPFELLKFRSMIDGSDSAPHREITSRFIQGQGASGVGLGYMDNDGRPLYKLADDDRVAPIGRFLRKYSLDELPQFWNVLKGDMSMVGPRPALEYEVVAYKAWHRRRLELTPGLSGLWQIAGRARVGFDEMVFQDIIYGYNQSVLTDVSICLWTVPAVLTGRGAV